MSTNPFGDQKPGPPAPQFGAPPGGASPELLSQANSAFNLAIAGCVVGFCCCNIAGVIMGVMAMNNAGSVIAMAPMGSEAHSKASSAKTIGIVAIVLSVINLVIGGASVVMQNMGN